VKNKITIIITVDDMKKKVLTLKETGRNLQKAETPDNKGAVKCYTEAIRLCKKIPALRDELPSLLTNRSKAYSDDKDYENSLKDTEESISVEPTWLKV